MESFCQKDSSSPAPLILPPHQTFPLVLMSGRYRRQWANAPTKCLPLRVEMLERKRPSCIRSALYIPAHRFFAISDRLTSRADALILDLEDTVPEAEKVSARTELTAATKAIRRNTDVFAIRIGNLESGMIDDDLRAVFHCQPDVVILPKADPISVARLAEVLRGACLDASIWPMIESREAVDQVEAIAEASARVTLVLLGSVDLGKVKGVPFAELDAGLLQERQIVSDKAQRLGIAALDGIFLGADPELLPALIQSRALGFTGRSLANPRQVALANQTFN
jgi:citrate lyase subunit beta / citryl-CoA lyase